MGAASVTTTAMSIAGTRVLRAGRCGGGGARRPLTPRPRVGGAPPARRLRGGSRAAGRGSRQRCSPPACSRGRRGRPSVGASAARRAPVPLRSTGTAGQGRRRGAGGRQEERSERDGGVREGRTRGEVT